MTAALDPRFLDQEGQPSPGVDEPVPMSDGEAERLIAHLAALDNHSATVKANAAALVRADEAEAKQLLFLHGDRLQEWTRAQLKRARRSVRVLAGVAGFRTVPLRLQVENEHAAVLWCREHYPAALVLRLDRAQIKASPGGFVNPHSGEALDVIPGLTIDGGGETFFVKSGLKRADAADDEGGDE